ncbi:MAG: hypothetical protein EA351_15355 [Gemmatimonadales bacterium]|nr:MAG: hypothetical protein EA351_15355 [Gemmatimonadales bacterium]
MNPRFMPFLLFVLVFVFTLGACGGDDAARGGDPVVRDSAGIQIIENPAGGSWAEAARWRLDEELRIGVSSGDPELQFGSIVGLDADSEGRIVTLDGQARRVRVFGADGTLLEAFGRSGGGPGELSQALLPAPSGLFVDSEGQVVIPDLGNQRLARFDLGGQALESPPIALESGIPMIWTRSEDRALYQQIRRMDMTGANPLEGLTDDIVRLDQGSATGETVLTLPAGESVSMGSHGMPEIRIFAPEPIWTVLGDGRLVTGLSSEYSLLIQDASGDPMAIVRRDARRRPVTEADERALRDVFRSAWDDQGQVPQEMVSMLMEAIQFDEQWPALARLMGGPDETLWVQRVEPEASMEDLTAEALQAGDFGSPSWDVFDADGVYLGVVEMPGGFMPFRFVGDHLYGVHRDDLEVQRVVRLGLVRGGD